MTFILFMIGFAIVLFLIFWMIFRPGKSQPAKKTKRRTKKTQAKTQTTTNTASKSEPEVPSDEDMKKIATELLKKNPEVVSHVVKQWLRN